MKTITLIIVSLSLLGGCNSGGGSQSTSIASTENVVTTDSETTAELSVPQGFNYRTETNIELSIDIYNLPASQSYLSLYSRYNQLNDDSIEPDASSRLVSTQLTGATFNTQLVFPAATHTLLVEIWTYGESLPIRQLVFVSADQSSEQPINIEIDM